ncbi:MAG: hypothetical protein HYX27_24090 [Acidobacteria bacterium]|nr:hypothetical protein [Acidobacteriota bacterium]
MEELDAFLHAAKARGASDEFLVQLMKEHGWPASDIYRALGRQYEAASGVPIPAARGRMESAREAFFHLLAFATLASWICATGSLWFELIDTWFPDATRSYNHPWGWRRVSWQMASIIVAFPAFVYATRAVLADMEANPDKAASAVRRWLTNIALLFTALIFIGALMAFVAAFLQGELTVRFVLQCLTVSVLAGAVFLYYSRGMAKAPAAPRNWSRNFALGAAAAIVLSLGLGFLKTGSPAEQRLRAEDRRRLQDLFQIASRVHDYWLKSNTAAEFRKLPSSLPELTAGANAGLVTNDPFSQQAYDYRPGAAPRYQLCAVFGSPTETQPNLPRPAWAHNEGADCLDLDASKYPDYPSGAN